MQNIYLGSDHAGFEYKQKLIQLLREHEQDLGLSQIIDLGPETLTPDDDYPEYAFRVAEQVANAPAALGILICGNGQGVCLAANKVVGSRAVSAFSPLMAASTRTDDHANILCLPARFLSWAQIQEIVTTWLKAQPNPEIRHLRRLALVKKYETNRPRL
ncbi:RpiB/LacA/LacB family sugar-phosphate isomerase [Candidatus Berkelbacteria bacterium]|nr:RpiB/LacA/LacB family sugar-phosphate isomerase [Candidatus Berkelbacteria bacterium]